LSPRFVTASTAKGPGEYRVSHGEARRCKTGSYPATVGGVTEGKFDVPDSIDKANPETEALFNGEKSTPRKGRKSAG
jgi:hypothetical protein